VKKLAGLAICSSLNESNGHLEDERRFASTQVAGRDESESCSVWGTEHRVKRISGLLSQLNPNNLTPFTHSLTFIRSHLSKAYYGWMPSIRFERARVKCLSGPSLT